MPCGCFGAGKKAKGKVKAPPSPLLDKSSPTIQVIEQDDPNKTAKRRDVVASYYGDECALLGYKPTGSRPPSCVDSSPNSHTPSTEPLDPYSRESSVNSSSPVARRSSRLQGALCRSQLADKRREFFRDFSTSDYRSSPYTLSSTLPARTRPNFGKNLRSTTTRPLSQPCEDESPLLPPGPHLLHASPNDERAPKIDSDTLASQQFLLELKSASQEISRRWAMSEDELDEYPSTLKMQTRTQLPLHDNLIEEEYRTTTTDFYSDISHSISFEDTKSTTVPETIVTPPSPQVMDFSISQVSNIKHEDLTEENRSSSNSEKSVCMHEQAVSSEVFDNMSIEMENTSDEKFQVNPSKENEKITDEHKLDKEILINQDTDEPQFVVDFSSNQEQIINRLEDAIEMEVSPEFLDSPNLEDPMISPLEDFAEPEFATQVPANQEEPMICNLEDIVEPEFSMQVVVNQDEPMISPLDDDDDYPTNYNLVEESQTAMMELLERESVMDNVGIVENDDSENIEESTIIVNPYVHENDQEELITPHDSRLQLIAEEDIDESAEEDIGQPSSLSSEDGDLRMPSSSEAETNQTYEEETNVKNEKYNTENSDHIDLNLNSNLQSSEFVIDEHKLEDSNINVMESSLLAQEQYEAEDEKSNIMEQERTLSSSNPSEHPKMDSTEVIHDDGLGSEIEEGSDIIEEQQQARNVPNKPT